MAPRTLPTMDDATLVSRARSRDAKALSALYRRTSPIFQRSLSRVLGRHAELEDLVHEAFIRLLENLEGLEHPQALVAWTLRIGTHTAFDFIRRRRRAWWLVLRSPDAIPEPPVLGLDEEARALVLAIQRILDGMAPQDRIAFGLRVIAGQSLSEVADACHCSLATVKRRIARAEARFLALSLAQPALRARLESGDRWSTEVSCPKAFDSVSHSSRDGASFQP